MKVSIKRINSGLDSKYNELIHTFIKFLQKNYQLKDDITIQFVGKKTGGMSTGSQHPTDGIKVLTDGRLNRDIMRTLAHEWVHAYQINVLKREQGPNIGGQNEDEANAYGGRLIKMFEEEYPQFNEYVFEGLKGINNKINLINEQILISEKQNIKKDFIMEMKKIGIEKLPYSYSSMKQFVDPETMDIHYNKHYKGYVKKLNDALSNKKGDVELEDIIKNISKYDTKVRNNAGGAFNHALFWKMLSPKKNQVVKYLKKLQNNTEILKN